MMLLQEHKCCMCFCNVIIYCQKVRCAAISYLCISRNHLSHPVCPYTVNSIRDHDQLPHQANPWCNWSLPHDPCHQTALIWPHKPFVVRKLARKLFPMKIKSPGFWVGSCHGFHQPQKCPLAVVNACVGEKHFIKVGVDKKVNASCPASVEATVQNILAWDEQRCNATDTLDNRRMSIKSCLLIYCCPISHFKYFCVAYKWELPVMEK